MLHYSTFHIWYLHFTIFPHSKLHVGQFGKKSKAALQSDLLCHQLQSDHRRQSRRFRFRLFYLNLPTLKYIHLQSDIIEIFKNTTVSPDLSFNERANTSLAIIINCIIILFITTYESSFFSVRVLNIWNSLPNSVVDAYTVNAFKAPQDKFWQHQAVKLDFTADLTGTGNLSKEVIK